MNRRRFLGLLGGAAAAIPVVALVGQSRGANSDSGVGLSTETVEVVRPRWEPIGPIGESAPVWTTTYTDTGSDTGSSTWVYSKDAMLLTVPASATVTGVSVEVGRRI